MTQQLKDCSLLTNGQSIVPILNIVDFITRYDSANVSYAGVWVMYGLKNDALIEKRHLARLLTVLGIKTAHENQLISSEGLFRKALQLVADELCYENVEAHLFYSKMLEKVGGREADAENEVDAANAVIGFLPYWAPKLMHACLPQLDLPWPRNYN